MKTTIIPAQITTVEDKIAGSLSLTQILILMTPVFWAGVTYVFFNPTMTLAWYKVFMVIPIFVISFVLSLRVDDKLIANWLILLLRYNFRSKYYVFNKNDVYLRDLEQSLTGKKEVKSVALLGLKKKVPSRPVGVVGQIALESDKEKIAFKTNAKGGINVTFNQIEK